MQRWMIGALVGLLGIASAAAQQQAPQQRKADKGIVLEGEPKIRYILKQLELNPQQQTDAESLMAVYSETMKSETDPQFLASRLMEIQAVLMKRDEAKAAGDNAKMEEYNEQMRNMVPGVAPEKQFFEGLAPGLTDAQKAKLETVRERMRKDPDVTLKPMDIVQVARDQKLSAEQEAKLEKTNGEFRDEMTRSRPASLAERVDRTDQFAKKVRELLTADQAKAYDAAIERLRPPLPANLSSQPVKREPRIVKGVGVPVDAPDMSDTHTYTPEEVEAARRAASQPAGGAPVASQPAKP